MSLSHRLRRKKAEITRSHEVEFYSDDAAFVVGFTRFIEAALKSGNAVIVVATESHRKSLLQRLQEHGVDIVAAIEQGRYVSLDVAETLSTFMVNDLPDPARFLKSWAIWSPPAAKASTRGAPRVAVCGECASILWEQGKADAAIEVEHLWDEIAKSCNVDILCGYVVERLFSVNRKATSTRESARSTPPFLPRERRHFGPSSQPHAWNRFPERKGTLTWTVVPFSGCESIENVPSTSFTRCSILTRPSPRPPLAALRSKPTPRVAYSKMNLIRLTPQLHAELLHPAVHHPVVQRFL